MSILIDSDTRIMIQGITGKLGRQSARDLLDYGSPIVAGVVPARGNDEVEGLPVFATVHEAFEATGANTSLAYVPAPLALDAILEALEAGCRLIVYPGDGLPARDAMRIREAARSYGAVVIGPNTPGLIAPDRAKVGFMPSLCFSAGPVGVISRSGSLSYEVCHRLSSAGLGQSTVVGIGGDPVKGLRAAEAAALFQQDPETRAIVYLGEIGGTDENEIASYARQTGHKPVAALVVGRSAPPGKKMGHAAALIGSYADTHEAKMEQLRSAGVIVVDRLSSIVDATKSALAATESSIAESVSGENHEENHE